ncbi:hypothetical protein TgHK011_006852 [Trichoderma gracile]|nr:hypothetical protein TgHK011_006852 [Trichoderma gracile]
MAPLRSCAQQVSRVHSFPCPGLGPRRARKRASPKVDASIVRNASSAERAAFPLADSPSKMQAFERLSHIKVAGALFCQSCSSLSHSSWISMTPNNHRGVPGQFFPFLRLSLFTLDFEAQIGCAC